MKNKFALLLVSFALLVLVLGCGSLNPFGGGSKTTKSGNSTSTNPDDKTSPGTADEPVVSEKTGVPECDELIDFIAGQSVSKDETYVEKAAREFMFNRIRESLRKSIEENKNKPTELAEKCKEFKTQLATFKSREDVNK